MQNFNQFGLSKESLKALNGLKFNTPTPVQSEVIPLALKRKDILASAQTGSGKTIAYVIPIVEKLRVNKNSSALVLLPTRELASQVTSVMKIFLGYKNPLLVASLIGGEGIYSQINQLKKNPQIIVGTPGRINDHLERRTLSLKKCDFVVLDETDRMLDMGFGIQVNRILKFVQEGRQMLMLSATLPSQILKLSKKYLNKPVRVSIKDNDVIEVNIKQHVVNVAQNDKHKELVNQISSREGSILIFVKTKYGTEKLTKRLSKNSIKATALHGGLRQNKRTRIMENFRTEKIKILVATDIASRGLDIPHIEHVINFDLPQASEDFIHRIGRTARAGSVGEAVSFVTPNDARIWKSIERILNLPKEKNSDSMKTTVSSRKFKRRGFKRRGSKRR